MTDDAINHSPRRALARKRHSQSVQVYLGADVFIRERRHTRHDVVVIPEAEVLVLQRGAVVHLRIEVLGGDVVEYPAAVERRWAMADETHRRGAHGFESMPRHRNVSASHT